MKRQRRVAKVNHDAAALVAERADEWLERLKQPHDLNDRAEFLAWLKESPLHVREVLCATTWDKLLEHMLDPEGKLDIGALRRKGDTNVVQFGNGIGHEGAPIAVELPQPRNMQTKRIGWSPVTGLAAAAACLTLAVMFAWGQLTPRSETQQQQYVTTTGEQRSVGLSDGSIVHINTQSRVRVAFSDEARDVELLEGQAIFKVKHDTARPFRVHVGSAVVQAIGTQFDVHRLKDRTNVAVIEGVVQIISGTEGDLNAEALSKLPENTKVPAGESVVIIADGKLLPHVAVSPEDAGAWQQRRLIFHKQTLAEIAAEFNRYNRTQQIRIEGDALRARRLTGVFDADDPHSLLDYLSMDKQVVVDRTGNELVIRLQGFAQAQTK